MIYRVYNPSLSGLENEGAYLLMCKEAMPDGLLGLMLGGMIFATASSLNATLNISAGVVTNDIFKRMRPDASEKTLMNVARISTWGFGIMAIIIALLIRSMGGIVNVVISVAALTGVPVYLPVIWSLFSKRQTARTILSATFISLTINLIFKFVTPHFGLALDRTWEMIVGTAVPVILLAGIEVVLKAKEFIAPEYMAYISGRNVRMRQENAGDTEESKRTNRFTQKVLGIGLGLSGVLITVLGFIAEENIVVPVAVGLVVTLTGIYLLILSLRRPL